MKIRILLSALCLLCGMQSVAYGQQSEDNCQFYNVPPRKEIRHKIAQRAMSGENAEDNSELWPHNSQLSTRASGEYIMNEFPTVGEIKGVVILAAFADVPFSIPSDSLRTLLSNRYDGDGYTESVSIEGFSAVYNDTLAYSIAIPGSARDYFRDQSFGKFVPHFDVIGPVTLDYPRAYYGANNSNGKDKNTAGMIQEACQKVYDLGLTDFTDYDNDNDGVVDFVHVVYAGSDEAQTGIEECIWAKASNISQTLDNRMKISRYACSSELLIDLPVVAGIGTLVHEFGHILGLPDFYNTSLKKEEDDFAMDVWSVMDYGLYNADGFVPCGYTAFERYSLGWLPMHTLDSPATLSIGTTDEEGRGYRIFTASVDSTTIITEADTASFYVVETIRRKGWNRYAPANGLLISEVTYEKSAWTSNKVNTDSLRHRHCIVPANNIWSISQDVYNPRKHLFGNENYEFMLSSTPASITQFGATMDKPLTDIRYDAEEGVTTFHFRGGGEKVEIDEITIDSSLSAIYYDLQGRPVTHPTKGVYIVNGKKMVLK